MFSQKIKSLQGHLKEFFGLFASTKIARLAAALSYHTLMSIIPIFTIVFWYLNRVGITEKWSKEGQKYLLSHLDFGGKTSAKLIEVFNTLTQGTTSSSWGLVALGVFLYTSINLLITVGDSLDQVLGTKELPLELHMKTMPKIIRRFTFLSIFPITLIISMAIMSWIRNESLLRSVFNLKFIGFEIGKPLPYAIDILTFFFVYKFVPSQIIPWKRAFKGALLATLFFNLGKYGMGIYARYALTNQKIYGAFAVLPMFLVWVQFAWMIFLTSALSMRPNFSLMGKGSAKKEEF